MTEEAKEVKANEYPKWIDHPTNSRGETKDGKRIPERVLVASPMEESQVLGTYKQEPEIKKPENKPPEGWTK